MTYPGFSGVTTAVANEFSGVTGVDQHGTNNGNGSSLTVGPVTTTHETELIFGSFSHSNSPVLTVGCGLTAAGKVLAAPGGGQKSIDTGYEVTSAAGNLSACASMSPYGTWWNAAIVTYY
jgi:hypothetical protein